MWDSFLGLTSFAHPSASTGGPPYRRCPGYFGIEAADVVRIEDVVRIDMFGPRRGLQKLKRHSGMGHNNGDGVAPLASITAMNIAIQADCLNDLVYPFAVAVLGILIASRP